MSGEGLRFTADDVDSFHQTLLRLTDLGEMTVAETSVNVEAVEMFARFLKGDPDFHVTVYSPQAFGEPAISAQEVSR